ncbi:hypothetical protein R1sor_006947 [Riccia sorocarpa]|uniref:Uncharacterized protein n=1 Tax=Riccia sorocarpa TaxID=122646 RepID=A0ABD3HT48_9MARC
MSAVTSDYAVIASSAIGRKRSVALLFRKDFQLLNSGGDSRGSEFEWFVDGDWNVVTVAEDSSPRSNVQSDEVILFQELCNKLGVHDARAVAIKLEGPKFTIPQFREGRFTLSCVDRMYVPDCEVQNVHHSRFWTLDHISLSALISLHKRDSTNVVAGRSGYFKTDTCIVQQNFSYLKDIWAELQDKHSDCSPMEGFL